MELELPCISYNLQFVMSAITPERVLARRRSESTLRRAAAAYFFRRPAQWCTSRWKFSLGWKLCVGSDLVRFKNVQRP